MSGWPGPSCAVATTATATDVTQHVVDTIDRARPDAALKGAMRWAPALPPAPTCRVCGALLPIRDIDITRLDSLKPEVMESPGECPNRWELGHR